MNHALMESVLPVSMSGEKPWIKFARAPSLSMTPHGDALVRKSAKNHLCDRAWQYLQQTDEMRFPPTFPELREVLINREAECSDALLVVKDDAAHRTSSGTARRKEGASVARALDEDGSRSAPNSRNPDSADCTPVGERSMASATLPNYRNAPAPTRQKRFDLAKRKLPRSSRATCGSMEPRAKTSPIAFFKLEIRMSVLPKVTVSVSNAPKSR